MSYTTIMTNHNSQIYDNYFIKSPFEGVEDLNTITNISSPYAVEYVDKSKDMAVLFAYDLSPRFQEKLPAVKLQGLDPDKKYLVKEINLMPGTESTFAQNGKIFSGDYLMKVGLNVFTWHHNTSAVIELVAQ